MNDRIPHGCEVCGGDVELASGQCVNCGSKSPIVEVAREDLDRQVDADVDLAKQAVEGIKALLKLCGYGPGDSVVEAPHMAPQRFVNAFIDATSGERDVPDAESSTQDGIPGRLSLFRFSTWSTCDCHLLPYRVHITVTYRSKLRQSIDPELLKQAVPMVAKTLSTPYSLALRISRWMLPVVEGGGCGVVADEVDHCDRVAMIGLESCGAMSVAELSEILSLHGR